MYVCICACIHIYMYIHTHTDIYLYIQTDRHRHSVWQSVISFTGSQYASDTYISVAKASPGMCISNLDLCTYMTCIKVCIMAHCM